MKAETLVGLPFDRETPALALVTRAFASNRAFHSLLTLYCVLRDFARSDLHVPTNDRISTSTALSEITVKRGLRVLEKLGLVVRRKRGEQRVVHVPSRVTDDVFSALCAVAHGEVEIDMATAMVTHRACGKSLAPESFERTMGSHFAEPKGLPVVTSPARSDTKFEQVSLFESTTSSGISGNSPSAEESDSNSFVICNTCYCFLNMLVHNPEITGINSEEADSKKGRPEEPVTADIIEVFEFWKKVCNYPTAKLTKKVASNLRSRLRTFSVDELKTVATHGATDPWLNGTSISSTKAYNLTETLYRSDDRTAKYLLESKGSKAAAKDTRAVELSATKPVTGEERF